MTAQEAIELLLEHGWAVRDCVLARGRGIAAGKRLARVESKVFSALVGRKPTKEEAEELRRMS
jgi:hypothetical protein